MHGFALASAAVERSAPPGSSREDRSVIRVIGLGAARIEIGTMCLTPAAAKRFGLLLYLAAERGKHVTRSTIRELLFSDLQERNANHALRELVYQLRRAHVPIRSDDAGLMVSADDVRCDWLEDSADGRISTDTLKAILNGFLPGYAPEYSEAYREWLDGFRARATFTIVKACLREIDSSKAAGDWTKTELAARACLALDPMNGHATIALAEMLTIGGCAIQAAELLDAYSADLGPGARKLAMPVAALRRRIAETKLDGYDRPTDFEFAGRGDEMRALSAALDEVRRGASCAVLLTGEAGIGKSRIATEFGLRATLEGLAVVRTNAHPHDRHRPMGAFVDLVPLLLKQPGALGCSPESMEWLKRLLGRKTTSLPDPAAGLSSDETAHAVARSVFDIIESVAGEAPLLIIIDDIHWVDDVSLQLLRDIVVGQRPGGVLIVLTTREEEPALAAARWGPHFVSRRVEPLDLAVSESMIAKQLRLAGEQDASLSAWMAEIASGNPFYADSLVTHFRASGERFVIPPQLNAIVDQRLAAVSVDARVVLEAIVALGKHATIPRIELVLEDYGAALIRHVRELGVARLIKGDLRLAASHWLIAESVQRNAVAGSQRLLYRRIASVLERELRVEGDSSELWECAEAWSAAGEPDHAAAMIATFAEHAFQIGRAREAADLYYRAAGLASPNRVEHLAKASIQAAISALDSPAVLRGVALLRGRAEWPIHDDFELADVRARLWADCSIAPSLDLLTRCIQARDASVTHRLLAARAFLAGCEYGPLVYRAVALKSTIEPLVSDTTVDESIRLPSSILFYSIFGDVAALLAACQQLVDVAGNVKPPDRSVGLLQTAAVGFHKAGSQPAAFDLCKRALNLCAESGSPFAIHNLRMALAAQYLDAGDITSAREWFDQVTEPDHRATAPGLVYSYYATSAELAIQTNDVAWLHRLCSAASDLTGDDVSARTQRYRNLFECLGKHLDGIRMPVPDIIQMLTAFHVPGFEDGDIGDFEMAVLLMILRDREHQSLARTQALHYLKDVRRPFMRVTATLNRVAATIDQR
jgi:DNA-binding SARP family transcriptional activator